MVGNIALSFKSSLQKSWTVDEDTEDDDDEEVLKNSPVHIARLGVFNVCIWITNCTVSRK